MAANLDRRNLLKSAAAGSSLALLPLSVQRALALEAPTGGLSTIEHVVILMQENRSFDHYLGTLPGVRGFNDPTALKLPNGQSVFRQPNGSATNPPTKADGYTLPYRIDDQFMTGLDHSWSGAHNAWNNGRMDQWVPVKSWRTMAYHDRSALPFYHALADAFTVCDHYFCSVAGPTNPNRFYLFSGTIGYEPGTQNRAIGNDAWQNPGHTGYTWTSYAERLQAAGKTWKVYQEWDNYGDNSLDYFASFLAVGKLALSKTRDPGNKNKPYPKLEYFYYAVLAANAARRTVLFDQLAQGVATLTTAERSLYDRGLARVGPDSLGSTIRAAVQADALPAVSWIVPPEKYTEHPSWGPNTGAGLVKQVLDAIASTPAVWNKTLILINYDENDGYFDHLPQPAAPVSSNDGKSTAATTDEIYQSKPIGLGQRVPMFVISPWSRGGKVSSEVFDHTSAIQFLEQWTGVAEPNISPWRRAVCGDLTSAIDTTTSMPGYPQLPTPTPTPGSSTTYPDPSLPQRMPVQEGGTRAARPLPYSLGASGRVTASEFDIDFANTGTRGAHFYVYANAHRTDGPWRYTVEAGKTLSDYWIAGTPTGAYDLSVLGPNGFLRRFKGNRVTATASGSANPEVTLRYAPTEGVVYLTMTNRGTAACIVTVSVNNRSGGPWTYNLAANATVEDWWSTTGGMNGWYDLTATANTADGFLRRFAGHVETGAESTTDPMIGTVPLAGG